MKSGMSVASAVALALAISPVVAQAKTTFLLTAHGKAASVYHRVPTSPAVKVDAKSDGKSIVYKVDDGSSEDAIGFGNGTSNVPALWFNQFKTKKGGEAISSVEISYGTPSFPQSTLDGQKVTVCVWSDPDGDGTPNDAKLLGKVKGTISNSGTDTLVTYTFAKPVQVGAAGTSFFAGEETPAEKNTELFFQSIDETDSKGNADSKGVSWVSANANGGKLNIKNPGKNDTVGTIDSFGLPGNWLIRATGVPGS